MCVGVRVVMVDSAVTGGAGSDDGHSGGGGDGHDRGHGAHSAGHCRGHGGRGGEHGGRRTRWIPLRLLWGTVSDGR